MIFWGFGNTWHQQLFEFDLLKYNEIMIVWKNIELSNTSTSLQYYSQSHKCYSWKYATWKKNWNTSSIFF
jgi:hypothetical protein